MDLRTTRTEDDEFFGARNKWSAVDAVGESLERLWRCPPADMTTVERQLVNSYLDWASSPATLTILATIRLGVER